ncbi:MAG: hypothetical protein GX944_01825, partial [Alphaproteobacteria bacterium]|nr:hypothetical protein [Alphaproteobacteria bacterium]
MADFNKSIIFLSKWLNLHSADEQYLSQAAKFAKEGKLNTKMKKAGWEELFVQDSAGNYPEPDPTDPNQAGVYMDDIEWEKLYREFLKAFRKMDENRKTIRDVGGAEDYLNLVYGYGCVFAPQKIESSAKSEIQNLLDFLRTSEGKNYGRQIARQLQIEDFNKFLADVSAGKYETNGIIKQNIKGIIDYLQYYQQSDSLKLNDAASMQKYDKINFEKIEEGFDPSKENISNKIHDFKFVYPELLRNLVLNKDLRDCFAKNDGEQITKPITKALEQTDYSNSESEYYVEPSEKDVLTPAQKLKKKLEGIHTNTIGKLKNAALRDKYLMPDISKPIAVAIYDAGFHPKDGLKKFLELSKDIEKKFKGKDPKAAESFSFLVEVLNYAQTNTPKQFEGALKNGRQGLGLDILIAQYGIRKGKSDEQISAAHEVLSKLRWGYTTSVLREKLAANPLSIFSDPQMSYNKDNKAMQFISKAVDKTLHYGVLGVFNVANMGVNAIRRRGKYYKVDNLENKRIEERNKEVDARINAKGKIQANIQNSINTLKAERTTFDNNVKNLAGYEVGGQKRNDAESKIQQAQVKIDDLKSDKEPFETRKSSVENRKEIATKTKNNLVKENQNIKEQIEKAEMELEAEKQGGNSERIAVKQSMIDQFKAKKAENDNKIKRADVVIGYNDNISKSMDVEIGQIDSQIDYQQKNNIDPLQNNIDAYDSNKSQLDDIDQKIAEQEKISASLDEEMDKMENQEKRRFLNLMATRNMMNGQGGYTKNRNLARLFFKG